MNIITAAENTTESRTVLIYKPAEHALIKFINILPNFALVNCQQAKFSFCTNVKP